MYHFIIFVNRCSMDAREHRMIKIFNGDILYIICWMLLLCQDLLLNVHTVWMTEGETQRNRETIRVCNLPAIVRIAGNFEIQIVSWLRRLESLALQGCNDVFQSIRRSLACSRQGKSWHIQFLLSETIHITGVKKCCNQSKARPSCAACQVTAPVALISRRCLWYVLSIAVND